jgi:hypothetical protein
LLLNLNNIIIDEKNNNKLSIKDNKIFYYNLNSLILELFKKNNYEKLNNNNIWIKENIFNNNKNLLFNHNKNKKLKFKNINIIHFIKEYLINQKSLLKKEEVFNQLLKNNQINLMIDKNLIINNKNTNNLIKKTYYLKKIVKEIKKDIIEFNNIKFIIDKWNKGEMINYIILDNNDYKKNINKKIIKYGEIIFNSMYTCKNYSKLLKETLINNNNNSKLNLLNKEKNILLSIDKKNINSFEENILNKKINKLDKIIKSWKKKLF